jgi:small subunit ribosomal protein S20
VANIKSQIKRNKQNEKRRVRNRAVRAELKTREKAAEAASGSDTREDLLRIAIKRIDMAQQKGVLHKNTAARRKSRLIARVRNSHGASA